MKKYFFAIVLFITGSAWAVQPPVKTNPEVEKLVAKRMVKYNNRCANAANATDLYLCHYKKWDELAEEVQGHAFRVQQARSRVSAEWYAEFDARYGQSNSPYKNCKTRYGEYVPLKAPLITECYIREYAYLDVMINQHNKGTWKSTGTSFNASSPVTSVDETARQKYIRSIKETNSNDYEGD